MTMPGDYSEELVELVARALWARANGRRLRSDEPSPGRGTMFWLSARTVLDALSSAGRLVPEGSEVRDEFGVRHHFQTGALGDTRMGSEEDAMDVLIARVASGLRTELIHRRVICTPWSPSVPDTEEGS